MKKQLTILLLCLIFSVNAQKSVTVFWDASYSCLNDDINDKIDYLDSYLLENNIDTIKLIIFSNDIISSKFYNTQNKELLIASLKSINYDGVAIYSNLKFDDNTPHSYMLFGDCKQILDKFSPNNTKPLKVVSSNKKCKREFISLDFTKTSFEILDNDSKNTVALKDNIINGVVVDEFGLAGNVSVVNKNNNEEVISDSDGKFKLNAKEGDTIAFKDSSKKLVQVVVRSSKEMEVYLPNDSESLDEVLVTANKKKTHDLVSVGSVKIRRNQLGYAVDNVSAEELNTKGTLSMNEAISGKVAGVQTGNKRANEFGQFIIRGFNSFNNTNHPLIIIDDIPLPVSGKFGSEKENYDFIDPNNIKNITVLKGLAATNKYGTQGSNGVILITTKTGGTEIKESKKRSIGTTKTYQEDASTLIFESEFENYRLIFNSLDDDKSKYEFYINNRINSPQTPQFFLDIAHFLKNTNPKLASIIATNAIEIDPDNSSVLKATAYLLQDLNLNKHAILIFKKLLDLKPKDAQSYRDLAIEYQYANDYGKAIEVYKDIYNSNKINSSVNFSNIKKSIDLEFNNLVYTQNISAPKIRKGKNSQFKKRIVFEWSDPDLLFDLQIVNPQKRFFTWSHSIEKNSRRINSEKAQGYFIEEFFISESDKGKWIFNIKFLNKIIPKHIVPYIKITVYNEFGNTNQTKSIKLIKMSQLGENQTVLNFSI